MIKLIAANDYKKFAQYAKKIIKNIGKPNNEDAITRITKYVYILYMTYTNLYLTVTVTLTVTLNNYDTFYI